MLTNKFESLRHCIQNNIDNASYCINLLRNFERNIFPLSHPQTVAVKNSNNKIVTIKKPFKHDHMTHSFLKYCCSFDFISLEKIFQEINNLDHNKTTQATNVRLVLTRQRTSSLLHLS